MDVVLNPSPLHGALPAIPSKSDVHRLLICAALADAPTLLELGSAMEPSVDMKATADCLKALGASIVYEHGHYLIQPCSVAPGRASLDCGESGSTLRFLLPVAAARCPESTFDGHGRLPGRPVRELLDAMTPNGVVASDDHLPLTLTGSLHSGTFRLPGNVSSQYITGLLLALPLLDGDSTIELTTPLQSAAYVDITLHALSRFGIRVESTETGWHVPGRQQYHTPGTLQAEGDWSNAAFFLAAGALTDHPEGVTVSGLWNQSPQGDKAIVEQITALGAPADWDAEDAVHIRPAPLQSSSIDLQEIPDLCPILAVLAAYAEGDTVFHGGARLRLKESDRIASVCAMLQALGASVDEQPDGMIIHGTGGQKLPGGTVDSCNDHRIVMASAIASLKTEGPVTILGAEAVNKSYPSFFDDVQRLGGNVHVL